METQNPPVDLDVILRVFSMNYIVYWIVGLSHKEEQRLKDFESTKKKFYGEMDRHARFVKSQENAHRTLEDKVAFEEREAKKFLPLKQAFAKAASFAALQMEPEDARAMGETLKAVKSAHLRSFEALLDNEDHVPGKVSSYGLGDLNVGTLSLWELNLLASHYERPVADVCKPLMSISQ